jgi:hypothetical protein
VEEIASIAFLSRSPSASSTPTTRNTWFSRRLLGTERPAIILPNVAERLSHDDNG